MIVSCPKCFLEQPLDHYCAGCGKELKKLLHEKNKNRSFKRKKNQFILAFFFLTFLSASYLYYSNHKTQTNFLSQNSNDQKTQIELALPKDLIVSKKPDLKNYALKDLKESRKTNPFKKNIPIKQNKTKKIKDFYFLSLEHCNHIPLIGELNSSQYIKLMKCAIVHFKTSKMKTEEILDEAPSFTTQFLINIEKHLITLNFILTTDLYIEEFKHTLDLDIESESAATIWANTKHNVESIEFPLKDMLESYATLALFDFLIKEEPLPKLYFLASYK